MLLLDTHVWLWSVDGDVRRVGRRARQLLLRAEAQDAIRAGDRDIGEVTSAAWSPALQRPIAFGYVHRDFLEPGTKVVVNGDGAEVSRLPFVGMNPAY